MKRTHSLEQKLAWGKEAVQFGSRREASRRLGVAESQIDNYIHMYRISEGLVEPDLASNKDQKALRQLNRVPRGVPRKLTTEEKAKDAARKREARLAAKYGPANGKELVPVSNGHDVTQYTKRINELEDELAHALEHCETLQKILMAVGKTL